MAASPLRPFALPCCSPVAVASSNHAHTHAGDVVAASSAHSKQVLLLLPLLLLLLLLRLLVFVFVFVFVFFVVVVVFVAVVVLVVVRWLLLNLLSSACLLQVIIDVALRCLRFGLAVCVHARAAIFELARISSQPRGGRKACSASSLKPIDNR